VSLLAVEGLRTEIESREGTVRAVDGVAFALAPGECFAFVGESGCGKTLTALSLLRLLPETGRIAAGRARLGPTDLFALPEGAMRAVRGRRIAMVFQEPSTALNPVLTIGRQVREAVERHSSLRGVAARARAEALLRAAGIAEAGMRYGQYPFQLSGGLRQRAMIAAALAADPEVLVADEPTTALDVTIQAQILDLLDRLRRERGMALLLITHDLGVVARMADRVAVMYAGEIVESAPRAAFFAAPQHPYTRALFDALPSAAARAGVPLASLPGQVPSLVRHFRGCRFAERCAEGFARCRDEAPRLLELGGGHAVRCHRREGARAPARVRKAVPEVVVRSVEPPVILSVRDLTVRYPVRGGVLRRTLGWVRAAEGVSFDLRAGRTLALVGESGSGKTTVGKAILQLVPPTSGSVRFEGQELVGLRRAALRPLRRSMQIVFQDPYGSLNPRLRVVDILTEGMRALGVGTGEADWRERAARALAEVGLPETALARYAHEFSGGQRQRIAIARALCVEPRLLVCDEPTSALDVSVQAQILNLLRALQERHGLAYIFITHNLAVVEAIAHEIAVMKEGRIVEQGPTEAVLAAPRHPYTRELLAAVPAVPLPA